MGRRSRTVDKFYCPKCGKKALIKVQRYSHTNGGWQRGYECKNQIPRKYSQLLNDGFYWSRRELQAAQRAEAEAYVQKHPECDCKIYVEGRDAEIADFGCVLDLMIRTDPPIKYHLLEKNSNIQKRGFEVIHSTETLDLVRLNDKYGVAIWLYWKYKWDPDHTQDEIDWRSLTHEAAAFITHRDTSLRSIFSQTSRYPVWTKPGTVSERSSCLRHVPFSGNLGKRKRAEIIEWTKALEANLAAYQEQAAAAVNEWTTWGEQLTSAVAHETKIHISRFNGKSKRARISINGDLTQAQIERIAEALKKTS